MDRVGRPFWMRTYGKQSRKMDAWLSPDNRRALFDSASDEATTTLTTKPAGNRSNDKKGNAASRHGVRQAKARAMECLRMENSDQEDSFAPSHPPAPMLQQNKPLRKGEPVSKPAAAGRTTTRRRKAPRVLSTSESDGDSRKENSAPKRLRGTVCRRKTRPDGPPDVSRGRFVTRRRGAAATTTKLNALAPPLSLDSSDDFVRGGGRRTGRAAFPRSARWGPFSAESSAAELGNTSGAIGACLRETSSLDSSTEPGLGPCHKRPLFCSTPSLRALARPRLQARRLHHPCASPSVSVIEINSLSVTQEEMEMEEDPPEDPLRPSPRAPVGALGLGAKQLSDLGEPRGEPGGTNGKEPPPQLGATGPWSRRSLNGGAGSQNESAEIQNGRPEPMSPELFSLAADDQTHPDGAWEETEGGGHFSSAAGRLERLSEDLKKMCMARHCVVLLERGDRAADVTRPQGETAYRSCLDDTRSVCAERSENHTGSRKRSSSATCGRSTDHLDAGVELRSATSVTVLESTSEGVPPEDEARADEAPVGSMNAPADVPRGVPKAGKTAAVAARKGKTRRSVSRNRLASTRKACVSGLSVSRWSRRDEQAQVPRGRTGVIAPRAGRAEDCSITELLSTRPLAQAEAGLESWLQAPGAQLCTPVRAGRLHLSFLLQDLTPETHTWSRLKAALSIHKKTKAFLTPSNKVKDLSLGGAGLADVSQDLFNTPFSRSCPQHLQSQLHKSVLSVCEDGLSDAEKVYVECGQQGALGWEVCLPPARMKLCKKIGEGTFGEVFSTTNSTGDTVALKIIPVEGSEKVNGEEQKTFGEILHEIIISKELSSLKEKQPNQTHGFIGLNDLHCVRGRYPPGLLKAWDAFHRQRRSENDRPDFFEDEQLFLILEFEFGGSDLENSDGKLSSLAVAKSILHQVTAALAVAEQELHFEHRDLHWGNVLVKTTTEKEGCFLLNGVAHRLDTRGVHVRIIDYSLSRLEIDGLTVSCDISEDEELFMGHGDYQFDIYRIMRKENSNDWSVYQPHSNVLWLHYLGSKLLGMKFRGSGRGARQVRQDLATFQRSVLQYSSATEVLHSCTLFQGS